MGLLIWITGISSASAQLIPDTTLPNPSTVTPEGKIQQITGGTETGNNLFHSFDRFDILPGETAYFDNALTIHNIITRVTGGQLSTIDGLIRTNGTANLFLLNPHGIVFGENAQLNIGGSFFASTAESIVFEDGSVYSATPPNTPPLLTVNVPIGLQIGANPAQIVNRSTSTSAFNSPIPNIPFSLPQEVNFARVGLEVLPGQTLALIGGDIQLLGGNLTASNGQLFLGSFTSEGLVTITPTPVGWHFNPNSMDLGNISLSENSVLNTSGIGSGQIDLHGGNVTLNHSRLFALTLGNQNGRGIDITAQRLTVSQGSQILSSTLGEEKGGNINIHTTDSVELSGLGFDLFQQFVGNFLISGTLNPLDSQIVLGTATAGTGNAGEITIETDNLLLHNGTLAGSTTFSTGDVGPITLRANVVELAGSVLNTGTLRGSTGRAGDIEIDTQRLILRNGAILGSITFSQGNSGNLRIRAADSVEILRSLPGSVSQTVISTNSNDPQGMGAAGNITIDTQRLRITEGAGISSGSGLIIGNSVFSITGGVGGTLTIRATESVDVQGVSGQLALGQIPSVLGTQTTTTSPGGDIEISTPVLVLRDGGIISAGSFGNADAGNITINAGQVDVIGSGGNGQFLSKIEAATGNVLGFSNTNATANAGTLTLNVDRLTVRDRATINVQALGTGNAGQLNIDAQEIFLDHQGNIDASTRSGGGGNIHLNAQHIQLRHGSWIETNAGNAHSGNITIDTQTLTALENSDISANSQSSQGGRVTISAQSLVGTEFRLFDTPNSDITATGGTPELNGVVELLTPEIDSTSGLVELRGEALDVSGLISQNPCRHFQNSSFTLIGRGGLPDDPRQFLPEETIWEDWRDWRRFPSDSSEVSSLVPATPSPPLIEAQSWIKHPDGTVELVVEVPRTPEIGESTPHCTER